ncbi:HEAT repeat domain-containing protein [Lichenicoccus sp.]|uniref:HEAT repeat domain-containing protein n=1 Tax=Lichenicoccus sp. TaxID=2781899 RepID=UPI003D133BB4
MAEQAASRINTVAKSKGWTVEAILADPGRKDLFDDLGREFLETNRSILEPELLRKAVGAEAALRLRIGIMLLEMGAPSGSDLVLAALVGSDPDVARAALWFCRHARWQQGHGLLVPLDEPKAAVLIQPFLSAADPITRQAAVEALCRLSDAGSIPRLIRLLTHEDARVRAEAALHLAVYYGEGRAWPVIQSRFLAATPDERYRLLTCLQGFALSGEQEVRARAAAFARRELAALYKCHDNSAANDASILLRALQALAPPWKARVLKEVLASNMAAWVKAHAAGQLAMNAEALVAEQYLLAWLDHPELAIHTFEIIRRLGSKANTPAIVRRLTCELGSGAPGQRLDALLDSIIAIGADESVDLERFIGQVQGWRRFELVIKSKRVPADTMLRRLDQAELIAMAGRDARQRFAERWGEADCFDTTMELLFAGGWFHAFDCEDADTYPRLVGELVALSGGEITIGNTVMAVEPASGLTLRLSVDGLTTLLKLDRQGDWIDVEGVLSGLNGLLEAMHSPRRYYALATNDQFAFVVLARMEAMGSLISGWAFPVGDPSAARMLGQEFEMQVVKVR